MDLAIMVTIAFCIGFLLTPVILYCKGMILAVRITSMDQVEFDKLIFEFKKAGVSDDKLEKIRDAYNEIQRVKSKFN